MVKDHSDSEKGNPLPPHRLLLSIEQGFFYMHHPTDRITHTMAFVTPVVEHWLEREIAQWVHCMQRCKYVCMHVCMFVYVCRNVCMYVYACIYVHVYMSMYLYIHTCIHTYIDECIDTWMNGWMNM